jgi:hypothetical protein
MIRDDGRIQYESILPSDPVIAGENQIFYQADFGMLMTHSGIVNQRGAGIWPHRPYDVALSREGWIYMSAKSRIYVLRPGVRDVCGSEYRECN